MTNDKKPEWNFKVALEHTLKLIAEDKFDYYVLKQAKNDVVQGFVVRFSEKGSDKIKFLTDLG